MGRSFRALILILILLPWLLATGALANPLQAAKMRAAASRPAAATVAAEWRLTLMVSSGAALYDYCILGVKSGATDAQDFAWDVPAMLSSMNSARLFLYAPHPEWQGVFSSFREDIKAPASVVEWTVEVSGNISGPLLLEWPDLGNLPDLQATLVDVADNNREHDMRAQPSLTFPYDSQGPRQFKIRMASPAPPPQDTLHCAFRNDQATVLYWDQLAGGDTVAGYLVFRKIGEGSYTRLTRKLVKKRYFLDRLAALPAAARTGPLTYCVLAISRSGELADHTNELTTPVP
ncbi:MAG: hypothetical protein AB1634_09225 [Thermodesulfobacteriota bacterium]